MVGGIPTGLKRLNTRTMSNKHLAKATLGVGEIPLGHPDHSGRRGRRAPPLRLIGLEGGQDRNQAGSNVPLNNLHPALSHLEFYDNGRAERRT